MRLDYLNKSISTALRFYDLLASLRDAATIPAGQTNANFDMVDVTATEYQTLFTAKYFLEDVGSIEVLDLRLSAFFSEKGNGSLRWQISGDGGITFLTMAEGSFNQVGFLADNAFASGVWLSTIEPGTDKLQIRFQAKAVAGIVSTKINDGSTFRICYRKKVLF